MRSERHLAMHIDDGKNSKGEDRVVKLVLIMAITADGIIARNTAHFPDWTGRADKRMFKQLSTQAGVVIMGSQTYAPIGKPLPNRFNVVLTRHPEKYTEKPNLKFSSDPPHEILAFLASKGYRTAILAGGATINTLFLRARLIDEMILTITPKLFGKGLSLFSESIDVELELLSYNLLESGHIMLRYRFLYD